MDTSCMRVELRVEVRRLLGQIVVTLVAPVGEDGAARGGTAVQIEGRLLQTGEVLGQVLAQRGEVAALR